MEFRGEAGRCPEWCPGDRCGDRTTSGQSYLLFSGSHLPQALLKSGTNRPEAISLLLNTYTNDQVFEVNRCICDHHQLFKEIHPDLIIPKFHFSLHLPRGIFTTGPSPKIQNDTSCIKLRLLPASGCIYCPHHAVFAAKIRH